MLALVGPILGELAEVAAAAEALPTPDDQREAAVTGLVALVVRHRRAIPQGPLR